MNFLLNFTPTAEETLKKLKNDAGLKKRYNAVQKTLKLLSENPRHPSLQTHQYYSISGPKGEKILKLMQSKTHLRLIEHFFTMGQARGK